MTIPFVRMNDAQNTAVDHGRLSFRLSSFRKATLIIGLAVLGVQVLESSLHLRRQHRRGDLEVREEATSFQQLQRHKDERNAIFQAVHQDTCHFPKYYERPTQEYNLTGAGTLIQPTPWRSLLKSLHGRHTDIQEHYGNEANTSSAQKTLTMVHVGKAGGSTVCCSIANARPYIQHHCDDDQKDIPISAISSAVNCYTHFSMHLHCYDVNQAFLVNTRNPLKRIMSWFLYEHVQNHMQIYPNKDHYCGQMMLYTCYPSIDQLVSVGLNFSRPSPMQQTLRLGKNLTEEECSHWAWAAVMGSIPASFHNTYNYDWYTHRLLKNDAAEIFVLRMEHLQEDWMNIDAMLGGTGSFPKQLQKPQNAAMAKSLAVTNNNISSHGMINLCEALCEEIQAYKRLLFRAKNIHRDDIRVSLLEVAEVCPQELDFQRRECNV